MAKGSYSGGGGGGLNALSGGAPMAPPGVVASGGGGPPPLPGAASPQPGAVDPQRMAMAENFRRQSMRGNREGRALSPMQIDAMSSAIMRGPGGGLGGGGGGMQSIVTPGGGNQNAFSPQPATSRQVPTGGFDSSMRLMLARLMAGGGGANKFAGTGDRGGYSTSA